MASYSNWITSRKIEYADAITEAYENAGASNAFGEAWTALSGDSDIADLLPTASDNAHKKRFWNTGGPTAEAPEILRFGAWLQANTAIASKLNLSVQVTIDTGQQSNLTNVGVVGAEYRQWKGQQVYTFANGIVVGRGSKLIASLGATIPELTSGLGTDVLIYFDGVPNSKGSTTRGTTVFNGDVVVSGSIQGVGGIVIIDDVIQLETGVHNPAGIGVNDAGKIMLRDRGDGFVDLIDSTERLYTGSIEQSKIWVGTQNTNSARHGTTLIPNGNFSQVTAIEESSTVVEYPSGAITIGDTSREINFHANGSTIDYGILSFDANGGAGFLMPAIPIECESYKVVVRFKAGTGAVDAAGSGDDNTGIYFFFHETSDGATTGLGDKEYVYHSSGGKTGTTSMQSGISAYTTNSTEQWLNPSSNNSYPNQGSDIPAAWTIKTFTYSPTKSGSPASLAVNWASFGMFAKNAGNQKILVDYIVMTQRPPLASDIAADIAAVDQGLANEVGSKIPDADFPVSSVSWRAWPISGAHSDTSITILPTGGDNNPATGADSALKVKLGAISTNCGLLSDAFYRENDRYSIGVRIRADANCDVKLCVVEESGNIDLFNSNSYVTPTGSNVVEVGTAKNTGAVDLTSVQVTQTITGDNSSPYTWYNVFGTYTVTGLSTVSSSSTPPTSNINRISFLLKVLTAGVDAYIDYAWMAPQTSSADISTALANQAVGDANTFVTNINDKLVKESGSLIPNASMALPSSSVSTDPPAGYRNHNATLTTETDATTGDKRIKVVPTAATGTLISPAFDLGSGNSSDKYAVGVLVKAHTTANIVVKVAYHTKQLSEQAVLDGKSGGYTTLAPSASSTDVLTGVSATARASEGTTSTWENILMTWDKKAVDNTAMVASVLVQGDATFYVDYIYAAAQACSFDLADTQAQARRDEAIAQASGALQGLTNGLNQEQGSLLANSSFGSYLYDSASTKQIPKNWAWTRSTTRLHRVVSATEVTSYNGQTGPAVLGEVIDNKNQVGACGLVTTGGTVNGVLSSYFTLPFVPDTESTFTVDSTDYSPVGKYTLSLKLKVSSANAVGIRLLAHESKSVPDSNQEFILCTTTSSSAYANTTSLSATARASSIHSDYSTKTLLVNDTTGSTSLIKVINISQNDSQAGYSSSDEYIEFFPVDNSETQGDLDATVQNTGDWYSAAGTYTPSTGAKFVSFEIIIEDTNAGSGRADVYIDYISLVAQTMDADFASTLAQARTEDLMDNLEDDPAQVGNLLANPYFTSAIKRTRVNARPKKWIPYRASGTQPNFSMMSFLNTSLNRGLKLGEMNGTAYAYKGVLSTPFRTQNPDYEILIRAKISSTDSNAELVVEAFESDSDIDEDWTQCITNSASLVPAGVNTTLYDGGGAAYTRANETLTVEGSASLTTSWQVFKIEYIPTSTARYASLRIKGKNLDSALELHLGYAKCQVDTPYKIMDRHLSTLFGDGDNLATLLATPSKVFTGPLGITNISEIKNTGVNQAFIETAMGSGWSKAATLNTNVATGTSALGYTPFHAGNKPTKSDVGLGAVQNYSATDLAGLTAFTDNFNKFEASDAVTAAGGMNLSAFSNFGSSVQTGVNRASVFSKKFGNPTTSPIYGKNELENADFREAIDIHSLTYGRPAHFGVINDILGQEGISYAAYNSNTPNSTAAYYDFTGDNRVSYIDEDRSAIHLKSGAPLIAKGVPLEGGKEYRVTVRCKLNSTSATTVEPQGGAMLYNVVSNTYSSYRKVATTMGTGYESDMDTRLGWGMLMLGINYRTAAPDTDTSYIVYANSASSGTTDNGLKYQGRNGEEYTTFNISGSSMDEYTATFTLPDDAIFGSVYVRRFWHISAAVNPSYGIYGTVGNASGVRYFLIENISLQQRTGTSVSSFVSLYNTLAGATATVTPTLRSNWNISDKHLKDNIQNIDDSIQVIKKLNPVKFTWKDNAMHTEIHEIEFDENGEEIEPDRIPNYGLIAQEIAEILPELVVHNASTQTVDFDDVEEGDPPPESETVEYMGVDYTQLIPIAIKAIQEQQEIIDSQRKDIDDLKELVNKLIENKGDTDADET